MLTDDEIKALLEGANEMKAGIWKEHRRDADPPTIAELCIRLLSAEARVKVLEDALRRIENTTPHYHYVTLDGEDWSPASPFDRGVKKGWLEAGQIAAAALQEQSK